MVTMARCGLYPFAFSNAATSCLISFRKPLASSRPSMITPRRCGLCVCMCGSSSSSSSSSSSNRHIIIPAFH